MTPTDTEPKPNKQLFENSGLKDLFEQKAEAHNPHTGYFNPLEPNLAVLHEKPQHRLVIWLKARGYSNNEIAEQTGFTYPWVSQILRQPWAQATLVQMQNELGAEGLRELIQQEGVRSLVKLVKLRDDSNLEESVHGKKLQAQVSQYLVDRYLGKPKESLEVTDVKDPKEMTRKELMAAIAREEQKEQPRRRIDLSGEAQAEHHNNEDHPHANHPQGDTLTSLTT